MTDLIKGEPERLLPVDSEHAALAMAMRGERREDIKRVVLTGSGGPFRGWTRAELARASVKEGALQHPVWSMGPKITIDSATLMNEGLEVIEAHYLFDLEYSSIHVLIPRGHGARDGRVPRRQPARRDGHAGHAPPDSARARLAGTAAVRVEPVPLTDRPLTFEPVDREAFPAVDLAYRVGGLGLTFPAVMNAANEVAVMAFLEGKDPPHPHRRARANDRRRARTSRGLGRQHRARRRVGPPARGRDRRGSDSPSPHGPARRRPVFLLLGDHRDPRAGAFPLRRRSG